MEHLELCSRGQSGEEFFVIYKAIKPEIMPQVMFKLYSSVQEFFTGRVDLTPQPMTLGNIVDGLLNQNSEVRLSDDKSKKDCKIYYSPREGEQELMLIYSEKPQNHKECWEGKYLTDQNTVIRSLRQGSIDYEVPCLVIAHKQKSDADGIDAVIRGKILNLAEGGIWRDSQIETLRNYLTIFTTNGLLVNSVPGLEDGLRRTAERRESASVIIERKEDGLPIDRTVSFYDFSIITSEDYADNGNGILYRLHHLKNPRTKGLEIIVPKGVPCVTAENFVNNLDKKLRKVPKPELKGTNIEEWEDGEVHTREIDTSLNGDGEASGMQDSKTKFR